MSTRWLAMLCALLWLSGCKIHAVVPEGGKITSDSGNYTCHAGSKCVIDVSDTQFDELFRAVPQSGYYFKGWKKQDRSLCGGTEGGCALSTHGFVGQPALLRFLESEDEVFLLAPEFAKAPANWTLIEHAFEVIVDEDLRECVEHAARDISYAEQLQSVICANSPFAAELSPDIPKIWRIKNFRGIEQFRNLRTLRAELDCYEPSFDFSGPCGTKFEGLEALINLRQLSLYGDIGHAVDINRQAVNVDFLSSMTQLRELEMPRVRVADLSVVGAMTNLRALNLRQSFNQADMGYLRELINLHTLEISDCLVDDLSIFSEMRNLRKLDLNSNWGARGNPLLRQIAEMPSLQNLTSLSLFNAGISDISPLAALPDLRSIRLGLNEIEDISVLAELRDLRELSLTDNPISYLEPLSSLTRLELLWLYLSVEDREQVGYLQNLRGLRELRLIFMKDPDQDVEETFVDYSFLQSFKLLEKLEITQGGLEDISFATDLVKLEELILPINSITDVSSLRKLVNLRHLDLAGNGSSGRKKDSPGVIWYSHLDVSPLGGLTNLETLDLSGNGIESITPLHSLDDVEYLNLELNNIIEIDTVLRDMASLFLVNLRGNPLDCNNLETYYPGLFEATQYSWGGYSWIGRGDPYFIYPVDEERTIDIAVDTRFCR